MFRPPPFPGRRQILAAAGAAGLSACADPHAHPLARPNAFTRSPATNLNAQANPQPSNMEFGYPALTQKRVALRIGEKHFTLDGAATHGTLVNQMLPGPVLHWQEGDAVEIAVTNTLRVPTSIHWHGLRVPSAMDGVPGLSFAGIAPGETFTYRFPLHQAGTYWYHSHSGYQEQTGLLGALVIAPREGEAEACARDYVVLLQDWPREKPETILANLKMDSEYYNYGQRTVGGFLRDVRRDGLRATLQDRLAWGRMNMTPTDISDVSAAAYTYLLNGQSSAGNWTGLYKPGEKIRLRLINGSSMTFFDLRIPGLQMQVVAADGNAVEPVLVDELRLGVAETYDVIVQPGDGAWSIFAQSQDRSGYVRGTLATQPGQQAPVPPMDPRPLRTMQDMGMAMHGHADMAHMAMGSVPPTDHGGAVPTGSTPGMDGMAGMGDMPAQGHSHGAAETLPTMAGATAPEVATAAPALRRGIAVDNVAMVPQSRLAEAGDGLDGNGRRVLTYADLRARQPGADPRPPSRELVLHLTGNMERYIWGFDGLKFSQAPVIQLQQGERVRFTLINDTMMDHPIHLHGLWSELENGQGAFRPYKHTVVVKPGERLSYLVTADVAGLWAYHCHLLFHMETGMFRTVSVA